jgi:type I restriction enzyme S subunit
VSERATVWPEVPLGEICEFKYGRSLPGPLRAVGDVPVYGSNGIVGAHNAAITNGPAIVVGRKGSFGEVAFSPSPCWPIDTTYYIDGTATKADLRWLAYRLSALGLTGLNRAAAIPGLNREDAYRQRLLLPSLPEQRQIAEVLDRAETLRAKRRAALAQLDTLTQSIFLDMFGDPIGNQRGWRGRQLSEVVREGTTITYGIVQAGDEHPGGVPYIRTGDIADGEIAIAGLRRTDPELAARFSRSRVEAGDIVMSIRATVGTTALVPRELHGANLTQGTARIAPGQSVEASYLLAYLRAAGTQNWIGGQIKGATFREITLARLRELPVLVPPLELQREFATRVESVEQLKVAQRASLAQIGALFTSVQQRAFRGDL